MGNETDGMQKPRELPTSLNYLKALNELIEEEGGLRSFCHKHSFTIPSVRLVVSGLRSASPEFVQKIRSIKQMPDHLVDEPLSLEMANRIAQEPHRALDESEEIPKNARARQRRVKRRRASPRVKKPSDSERDLERHRKKILREELLLAAAQRRAKAVEERRKIRELAKNLSRDLIKKSSAGALSLEDLARLDQIINGQSD